MAEQCLIEYEHYFPSDKNYKQRFGVVLWKLGKKKEAMNKFDEVIREYERTEKLKRPEMINNYYDLAGVNAFIGRKEEAYRYIRKWEEYGLPVGLDRYALIDPLFEPIRNDEAFKKAIATQIKMHEGLGKRLMEIESRY